MNCSRTLALTLSALLLTTGCPGEENPRPADAHDASLDSATVDGDVGGEGDADGGAEPDGRAEDAREDLPDADVGGADASLEPDADSGVEPSCLEDEHLKEGACVPDSDSECGSSLANCTELANTIAASCVAGACLATACEPGYRVTEGACDTDFMLTSAEFMAELEREPRAFLIVEVRDGPSECIKGVDLYIGEPRYADLVQCIGPDLDRKVILQCGGGGSSGRLTTKLKAAGYRQVFQLTKGINKFKADGYQAEVEPCPAPSPKCDAPY